MGSASRVDVDVCESFADRADFQSDTSHANNVFDVQLFANRLDACGAMRAANRHRHEGCGSFSRDLKWSDCPVGFQESTEAVSCIVEFLGRWLIYDPQDRCTVDDQSDLYGKFSTMFDELPRAVHRIDHPNVGFR